MARVEKRPDQPEERSLEDEHLVEIDADEFEEARRDPKVRAFAARADAAARTALQSLE